MLTPGQKAARTRVLRRMELERKATLADATIERTLQLVRELDVDPTAPLNRLSRALGAISDEWGVIERFCDGNAGDDWGEADRVSVGVIADDLRAEDPEICTDDLLVELYEEARNRTLAAVRRHLEPAMNSADAEHTAAVNALDALDALDWSVDVEELDELERDLLVAQIPIRGTSANG